MTLERQLKELRLNHGVIGAALIGRAGEVLAADMPEQVSRETFGVMCATILGAGTTAAGEIRAAPPSRVVIDSVDARVTIFEVGRRAILIVVTPPSFDESRIAGDIRSIIEEAVRQRG